MQRQVFSFADSVYGTVFFASTGLHGSKYMVPIKSAYKVLPVNKFCTHSSGLEQVLSLETKSHKYYLDYKFIEWFSGFVDAEGNFNLVLRNLNGDNYSSVMATFQIGLHIDDLPVLEFIKKTLNCGLISISGSRCNYFINDQYSLINLIIPIFKAVNLNTCKYYQFLIFEKVIILFKDKTASNY